MPVFIDAYNLLHAPMPAVLAGLDEVSLCQTLSRSELAGQRLVVVCDGSVKPGGPDVSPTPEVELIYSGPKRSADSVLIELIEKDSAPRRLVVVSDDREIQKAARRRRAKVMTCSALIAVLARRTPSEAPGRPTRQLTRDEVDGWLDEFDLDGDQPIDPRKPWWEE